MLRLILADDEKAVRETISRLIDWNGHGFELIGLCKNGIEAYDMILDEYPDVVMTDIKMPGLDGLDLIEKVRAMDKDIEFIILSGYGEFEFAKKAMRYGVKNYLLKPTNEQQIIEVLENIKADCGKKQELNRVKTERELLSDRLFSMLKRQFIIEAVTATDGLEALVERYSHLLEIGSSKPGAQAFGICYVAFLEENLLAGFLNRAAKVLEACRIKPFFNIIYVKNSAVLIFKKDAQVDTEYLISSFESMRLPSQRVTFSCRADLYDSLYALLTRLVAQLLRYDRVLLIEEDGSSREIYNYSAAFKQVETVAASLAQGADEDEIAEAVTGLLEPARDPELARNIYTGLLLKTSFNLNTMGKINLSNYLEEFQQLSDPGRIKELAVRRITELHRGYKLAAAGYKDFIAKTIRYMEKNYADPELSLKAIAEKHLFLNVNYLSKQFVKATGEKFSSRLNRIRMERAKALLLQYDADKIYAVAEQVGCGHNPRYFSQVFKKYTGLTPTDYVKKSRQGS